MMSVLWKLKKCTQSGYDIELMTIELRNLYDSRLIDHDTYMTAWRILKREHRIEESRKKGNL